MRMRSGKRREKGRIRKAGSQESRRGEDKE
jgi:hypothetical protein